MLLRFCTAVGPVVRLFTTETCFASKVGIVLMGIALTMSREMKGEKSAKMAVEVWWRVGIGREKAEGRRRRMKRSCMSTRLRLYARYERLEEGKGRRKKVVEKQKRSRREKRGKEGGWQA